MPSSNDWPRTIKRGALRGQTFNSRQEYEDALESAGSSPDEETPPGVESGVPSFPPNPAAGGRRGRPARGRVDKGMVTAILFPLNLGLYLLPQTRADALTGEEMDRLADAVVKVAAVNKHVERAILAGATSSAYVELAVVVGAIAVKRAANHGLLPWEIGAVTDSTIGLGGMPEQAPPQPEPSPNGYAPADEPVGATVG